MTLTKEPRYEADCKKLLKKRKLTQEQIDLAESLLEREEFTKALRFHQIHCKKDKRRHSVTIPNTGYRLLLSVFDELYVLVRLVDHDAYDRINKDC